MPLTSTVSVIGAAPLVGVYAGSVSEPDAGDVNLPLLSNCSESGPLTAVPSV